MSAENTKIMMTKEDKELLNHKIHGRATNYYLILKAYIYISGSDSNWDTPWVDDTK